MTTEYSDRLQRARSFGLASMLTSYPQEELELTLREVELPASAGPAASSFLEAGLDRARSAYIDAFDRGQERSSLYETEYGRMRGMSKGHDLADIAGFYRAFGFAISDEVHEMVDHIAVELEFYAVLLLKEQALSEAGDAEGVAIVSDARRKFLADHLGRLAPAIAARPGVTNDAVYGPVFAWCSQLVGAECTALGVAASSLDYAGDEELKRQMTCDSVRLPVIQD